ncbi:MAG: 4-(cytidine 5'-diphospho)-2-C-methyl-D-erythritol kinase [Bryobacteraceae bacterium]
MSDTLQVRVPAFAKINLGLKVLDRRADGFHELRTVFQTVSLADTLEIAFTPARATKIAITCNVEIPGRNLVERAALVALEAMRAKGRIEIHLDKRIPMGGGLGGGSSDAAAVLLALPVLAHKRLALTGLIDLAAGLGSDVPFFLLGGRAVALGRGTELYPLPDLGAAYGLLIAPGIHVSTPAAYRALNRPQAEAGRPELTSAAAQNIISSFQSIVWDEGDSSAVSPGVAGGNDFESVVFLEHPRLKSLKLELERLGARPAMLSGSGSALYGIFRTQAAAACARGAFPNEKVYPISLVSRARYRALWRRRLGTLTAGKGWPPQSR